MNELYTVRNKSITDDYPNAATQQGYKYQYNGKKWNNALGYNMNEMEMRHYDPAIARWVAQDPVTHHSMSPYNAFDNNPIFWADPSGADGWSPNPMNADAFYGFAAEQQTSVGLEGTSFVLNQTARMGFLSGDLTTGLSGMNPNAAKHSDGYFTYTSKTDHSTSYEAILHGVPQMGLGTLAIQAQWHPNHVPNFARTAWDYVSRNSSTLAVSTDLASAAGIKFSQMAEKAMAYNDVFFYESSKNYVMHSGGSVKGPMSIKGVEKLGAWLKKFALRMTVINSAIVEMQYQQGGMSDMQRRAEHTSNIIGLRHPGWTLGWELGRLVSTRDGYHENVRVPIRKALGLNEQCGLCQ